MHELSVGLCEDDAELRSVLGRALRAEGFEVRATATGHEAILWFSERPPDVVVLDVGLPDADGRDVCQSLRAHGVEAPVLFLTARDALVDRLAGFGAGGDDYLAKPFSLTELVFRIRALGRRAHSGGPAAPATATAVDGVRLDPSTHALHAGEDRVALTPTEFRVFATLAGRRGRLVRRRELIVAAWPDGAIVNDNTLDAYVGRLRRKLREIGAEEEIVTARGLGYTLE